MDFDSCAFAVILILCIGMVIITLLYFIRKLRLIKEVLDKKPNLNNKEMTTTDINNLDNKIPLNSDTKVDIVGVNSQDKSTSIPFIQAAVEKIVDADIPEQKLNSNDSFKLSQARIQGLSHKRANPPIPCQDFGKAGILPNGFHVIIISDGAGSSRLSHVASEYCVNTLFSNLQIFDFSDLKPDADDAQILQIKWNKAVLDLFGRTRNSLLNLSKENNVSPSDLYCTLLLVIKTDWGFLSANIGDGRSGVSNGKPHTLSVPLQTFTAGATFFLIKEGWENIFRTYTTPVADWSKIKYFFATTDGCQDFVMDWSDKGPRQGVYDNVLGDEARYDSNVPYEPFFDGLIASLNEVATEQERNERLKNLIEKGIYVSHGVEKELKSISDPLLDDDKTLLVFHK